MQPIPFENMTRHLPLRTQQSRDSLVRSDVRSVTTTDEPQYDHFNGVVRGRPYSMRASRVARAPEDTHYSPSRHQQASAMNTRVTSTMPAEVCHQAAPTRERFQPSPVFTVTAGEPAREEQQQQQQQEAGPQSTDFDPAIYTAPFLKFMTENPTVFHAIDAVSSRLVSHGFKHLSERDEWDLEAGGKYFITRNGSGLVAFVIGSSWKPGSGAAFIASHIDALTAKVKPISNKPTKQGYMQLGVAQYASGGLNQTWIDRDLGIGGRVFVRDSKTGKIGWKLVKIPHPVARIPSIAPHFGLPAEGQANKETRMVPIVGLDNSDIDSFAAASSTPPPKDSKDSYGFGFSAFASTQPPRLVKAIAKEAGVSPADIVNWELEMFSAEPAQLIGLDKEFISAGRIDDKMCSFAAIEALLASTKNESNSGILKVVGLFDDEEVGSLLRQGANSNFLPGTVERISEAMGGKPSSVARTFAKSFMISADVCHAYNPNYDDVYLTGHTPRLNVGVAISFDSNAHMTTDGVSATFLSAVAEKSGSTLQPFQIRNDSRSGGTVGPMLSSKTGMRTVDAGIPQLSMHSIRATTGSLDPGLGVKLFKGFFDHYEGVDAEVA